MRAVFINHCHPLTPHVCGVRAREFAAAMSRRGHRVLLLTETLTREDDAESPEALAMRIDRHDWSEPLVVACRPRGGALFRALRAGRLPKAVSKIVAGTAYVARGAVFPDWARGARPYFDAIENRFAPDVAWATFGNTESLGLARDLADRCGCPWVMDAKDYWSAFIPAAFRRQIARRFGNAALMTALSRGHAQDAQPFFGGAAEIVHSGIPDFMAAETARPSIDRNRAVIVGAVYDGAWLDRLLAGISDAATGAPIEIDYAGLEGKIVQERAAGRAGISRVNDRGFMPLKDLFALQRTAAFNAFVRSGPGWFQHKIPELIAAGRPIVCLPPPDDETSAMCAAAGVPLSGCDDATDVSAAVRAALENASHPGGPDRETLALLTWDARAEALEAALRKACR